MDRKGPWGLKNWEDTITKTKNNNKTTKKNKAKPDEEYKKSENGEKLQFCTEGGTGKNTENTEKTRK